MRCWILFSTDRAESPSSLVLDFAMLACVHSPSWMTWQVPFLHPFQTWKNSADTAETVHQTSAEERKTTWTSFPWSDSLAAVLTAQKASGETRSPSPAGRWRQPQPSAGCAPSQRSRGPWSGGQLRCQASPAQRSPAALYLMAQACAGRDHT